MMLLETMKKIAIGGFQYTQRIEIIVAMMALVIIGITVGVSMEHKLMRIEIGITIIAEFIIYVIGCTIYMMNNWNSLNLPEDNSVIKIIIGVILLYIVLVGIYYAILNLSWLKPRDSWELLSTEKIFTKLTR